MRSGGQLLVESLVALGATKAFGVPGESYLAVLDALHDTRGRLDFVLCRNEGGAAFMAAAWGKLTGQPGLCLVTRGPGVANAAIGVHTAMQDSAPMLLLVGQVGTDMRGREAFQEIDYRAVFGTMAKWAVEIDDADRIPEILARAWTTATTGRPGPVVIALPEDMLAALTEAPPLTGPARMTEPAPTAEAVARDAGAARGGRAATHPDRRRQLDRGGKRGAPRVRGSEGHSGGRGLPLPGPDRQLLAGVRRRGRGGDAGARQAADPRRGRGPRHQRPLRRNDHGRLYAPVRAVPEQTLIHVHASDREIGKIYQPALGIQAGPNAFAAALRPVQGGWADWRAAARAAWEASFEAPAQPSPVDMVAVTAQLRAVLPEDAILTNGAGNFTVWPNKFYKFGRRARLLAPQSGAMGYGLPAAVAAQVACPERVVVCFAGDGDFQMNCQELGTAMQAGAQPIVLILDNGIYGTIRAHQERTYPGRVSGTTMANPDFAMLARAYGYPRRARRADRGLPRRLRPRARLPDRRRARPRHLPRGADPATDPERDAESGVGGPGSPLTPPKLAPPPACPYPPPYPARRGDRMSPRFDTLLLTGAAGRLGTHLRRGLARSAEPCASPTAPRSPTFASTRKRCAATSPTPPPSKR